MTPFWSWAALEIWLTDATLLGLAYWLGRVHMAASCSHRLDKLLAAQVEAIDQVKGLRRKVDRLNDLYVDARRQVEELQTERKGR
jgi:hypothetical protein